ncbi:uncharacterized protein [Palaemon carinicauda]|uniref:uncharacterized protein isoform X2 n=1 Tax=Palaemon carinicauda TaxID=392227 RepID=UPI0035B6539E
MFFPTQGRLVSSALFLAILIQNFILNNSFPAFYSTPNYHLTSPWLKQQISAEALELQQSIARIDETLNRPNDYGSVMMESGEEDDQLSRLLYKLQNEEAWREELSRERKEEEEQLNYQLEAMRHPKRIGTKVHADQNYPRNREQLQFPAGETIGKRIRTKTRRKSPYDRQRSRK